MRPEGSCSCLREHLTGSGDVRWLGASRLVEFIVQREETPPEVSIVYGLLEDR